MITENVSIAGGENTSTSRTCTICFTNETTIENVSIPFTYTDNPYGNIRTATVTVTVNGESFASTVSNSEKTTLNSTVEVSINRTVQGDITIKFYGSQSQIYYGDYTYYMPIQGGAYIKSNAYEMSIRYELEAVWQISTDNDGFPYLIWYPPDETEFVGYQDPKPFNSWKIDNNNDGYPQIWGFDEIPTGGNAYIKTADGLVPVTMLLKTTNGLMPLQFLKIKE